MKYAIQIGPRGWTVHNLTSGKARRLTVSEKIRVEREFPFIWQTRPKYRIEINHIQCLQDLPT